jgi:hypothetical protein
MDQSSNRDSTALPSTQQNTESRDQDAIYQDGRVVARVAGLEIDMDAKELRISEIYNSDNLMIPEECEFQRFKIMIQRIAYASKIDKVEPHKGRILRGVTADILGYREQ